MNASVTAQAGPPLLFNWEAPRRRRLAIAGFLAGSVFVHAFCFYAFQTIYPPTIALLPAPARVTLLTPSSEEGLTLLRWVEAEDPALASSTQRSPETKSHALPNIEHVPSFFGHEPALQRPPPLIVDLSIPSAQPPGAVPVLRPKTAPPKQLTPTSVSFSRQIEDLGTPNSPSMKFAASTGELPEAARFRVGVAPAGEIRYCFPLNSSGDRSLDEQAREYLALCRFPQRASSAQATTAAGSGSSTQTDENLVWGIATIAWGSDVERVPKGSTSTLTP